MGAGGPLHSIVIEPVVQLALNIESYPATCTASSSRRIFLICDAVN